MSKFSLYQGVVYLGASAQNINILSGTHERTDIFKISANIGSPFKNWHKNIKLLKYLDILSAQKSERAQNIDKNIEI